MKPLPLIAAMTAVFLCPVHAEPKDDSDRTQAVTDPDVATLKKQLVALVKEDIQAHEKTDPVSRKAKSLRWFLTVLDDPKFPKGIENTDGYQMDSMFRTAEPSAETMNCYGRLVAKIRKDARLVALEKIKDLPEIYRNVLKRAIHSTASDEVGAMAAEIKGSYNALPPECRREAESTVPYTTIVSLLAEIKEFNRCVENKDTPSALYQWNLIQQRLRILTGNPGFISEEQNKEYLEILRKRAGIPDADELDAMLQSSLDELLDDKNQDRLDELVERIRQRQSMVSNSNSIYGSKPRGTWQVLATFSASFAQAVTRVKNGGVSQFSIERWQDESSDNSLMPVRELSKRLNAYQVRVSDENGKTTTEPLIYNIRGVLDSIQSLDDLGDRMPALKKASQYASGGRSDGVDWNQAVSTLESIAMMAEKLESGEAFSLIGDTGNGYGEYRRFPLPFSNHPASRKINAFHEELHLRILTRFYPEFQMGKDVTTDKAIERLLAKAKAEKEYGKIFTLSQLASYFKPGQVIIPNQEQGIIGNYIAGARQADEFGEARLATYYFQKASVVPSAIVPTEELKKRLQHLKTTFPADYEKGTDDFFKGPTGDYAGRFIQAQLVVPARK